MGNNSLPYEIVHCSSWDEDYDPEQLVNSSPGNQLEPLPIKCKGWQTPKCPEYPQDLIIHVLSGSSRISKLQILSHHFKIATKIDIYMGTLKDPRDVLEDIIPDTPPNDQEDNMLIEFRRLGHVCFDNNARAQFRARELKSIKINADGEYIRLVVRNCHRNRLNEYNQVGILALNILGQPLHFLDKNDIASTSSSSIQQINRHPFDDNSMLSSSTRRTSVSSNQSQVNKLPTSSVFEMELQHWIQALLNAEEEAVQSESYQIAKTYKYISDKLERFTKILADLEIGKRHAVETKDYDEAEKIKDDIKEIKQAAEIMLKQANIHITEDGRIIPIESTETMIDEAEDEFKPMTEPEEDVPLHVEQEYIPTDPDTIPEPIMEEERISYTLPIQLFGEETVACILTMKVKCRTKALETIQQHIDTYQQLIHNDQYPDFAFTILNKIEPSEDDDDEDLEEVTKAVSLFVNATLMMIQEAIMDARETIVIFAIDTWARLNTLTQLTEIHPRWIMDWTKRTFSGLLKRTGDSNSKIKAAAIALVLVLVHDYAGFSLMSLYVAKPDRVIHNHREAKARVELVEVTVMKLGIQVDQTRKTTQVQVNLENLMAFVVAYLNHAHNDVRQAAVKLVVTISDMIGFNIVSSYIDEKLRLSLTETVKKLVDNDPYHYYNKDKTKSATTKETMTELRALTVAKPEKKSTVSSKSVKKTTSQKSVPASAKSTSERKTTSRSSTKKSTTSTRQHQKPKEEPVVDDSNKCIFCDEVNPEFNEDTLIKHYYNSCPFLTNCPMCQIITEIPTLNEHMLVDCEKRHLIKECTRCHKAIPVEQWLQHTLKQVCQDSDQVACPLCSSHIEPPNDAGWKSHLLTGEGCPNLKKARKSKQTEKKKTAKRIV